MTVAELEQQSAIENFKMPPAKVGQCVLWFHGGERAGRDPHVAFVLKASHRNMSVKTIGGVRYDAVRHIDDPKLKMSDAQRENGAWDYTDDHKELRANWELINEQLAEMERRVKASEARDVPATIEKARKGLSFETVKKGE